MSETSLVDRLANLASRNSALEEIAAARDARVDLDTGVLVQLSTIIREPLTITDMRGFTLLLSDIAAPEFIPPLVDMIAADAEPSCDYTSSYLYALGQVLADSAGASMQSQDAFDDAFINQLGRWMLNTGGGELSWKSGSILCHIQVPAALTLMRKGAADTSLFVQTRLCCVGGLVNGLGPAALTLLRSLTGDSDPTFRATLAVAIAWLEGRESSST
jgi:hypothetical protein